MNTVIHIWVPEKGSEFYSVMSQCKLLKQNFVFRLGKCKSDSTLSLIARSYSLSWDLYEAH